MSNDPENVMICDCCGELKDCHLEMIGPTTEMNCEECAKIPPVYRWDYIQKLKAQKESK